jgi:hypothetical protein
VQGAPVIFSTLRHTRLITAAVRAQKRCTQQLNVGFHHALLCVGVHRLAPVHLVCVSPLADVPKALVGAAILRDKARPEWPDGSSMSNMVTAAAAAAAGAEAHECMPPTAYRELTAACWDHEARARWADSGDRMNSTS